METTAMMEVMEKTQIFKEERHFRSRKCESWH